MKRAFAVLGCAALTLCCACAVAEKPAYTVKEVLEQARAGWHQAYVSARGETVAVDVDIAVPNVDAFAVYYAKDMPAVDGVPTAKYDLAEAGENAFVNDEGFFRFDWPNRSTQRAWKKEAQKNGALVESFGEPRALMLRYGGFDIDTAYSVNNPTTMRNAAEIVSACVRTYFPNASVQLTPHWMHAHVDPGRYKKEKNTGDYVKMQDDPDFQGCLFAYFDQLIDGIPVMGYGYQGYADHKGASRKEEMRGNLGGICITQGLKDIGSDAIYRSVQLSLIEPIDLLAQDVPLCSLNAVIETAQGLIEAGQLRKVDSLRLGYVVWLDRSHTYKLMPTWVIEGELFEKADSGYKTPVTALTDQPGEYTNVYINAQTGELIDPWNTSRDRAYDAPELLK